MLGETIQNVRRCVSTDAEFSVDISMTGFGPLMFLQFATYVRQRYCGRIETYILFLEVLEKFSRG